MDQVHSPRNSRTLRARVEARREAQAARQNRFQQAADVVNTLARWLGSTPPRQSSREDRLRYSRNIQPVRRSRIQYPPLPRKSLPRQVAAPILKPVIEFAIALAIVALLAVLFTSGHQRQKKVFASGVAAEVPVLGTAAPQPPNQPVTILLMGSDRRGSDASFRTDVMMLVTIDAHGGRVSVLSFPRDLIGKIPGYGDGRINIVMARGGFELVQDTFEQSYGVRPQYYFLTNFEGFVGMINSIGGIEVNAAEPLSDSCDLPQSKAGVCTIEPGKHEMDGATALWYIRSRHTSSDFDRLRRAQEVMEGTFRRFIGMQAVTRLPELYMQYHADVETNMSISQIAQLLPVAARIAKNPGVIERFAISSNEAADWWMPDGARVLLPNYEAVQEIVRQAIFKE